MLICLSLAVGLFLIVGTLNYYSISEKKAGTFSSLYDGSRCRFSVKIYVGNDSDEAHAQAVRLSQAIRSDELSFDYCVFSSYRLLVADYLGSDRCIVGFDEGRISKNISKSASGQLQSAVKAFIISPSFFNELGISVNEGGDFSSFVPVEYSAELTVPVVLGDAYKAAYRVGDYLDCADILTKSTIRCEIVGFLSPGSSVLGPDSGVSASESNIVLLDHYVLMPFVDFSPLLLGENAQSGYHTVIQSCSGIALPNDRSYDFSPFLTNFNQLKIFVNPTMILGSSFQYLAAQYFEMLFTAAAAILIATVLCLTINLTNKLMSNLNRYAVYLLCGATVTDLYRFMLTEITAIVAASELIGATLTVIFGNAVFEYTRTQVFSISLPAFSWNSLIILTTVGAGVIVLTILPLCVRLTKVEFDTLLRGSE